MYFIKIIYIHQIFSFCLYLWNRSRTSVVVSVKRAPGDHYTVQTFHWESQNVKTVRIFALNRAVEILHWFFKGKTWVINWCRSNFLDKKFVTSFGTSSLLFKTSFQEAHSVACHFPQHLTDGLGKVLGADAFCGFNSHGLLKLVFVKVDYNDPGYTS